MPISVTEETKAAPRHSEEQQASTGLDSPYMVILYNCDCHTFDDVILQMQKATGCSLEKAEAVAYDVDAKGRAVAYAGTQEACVRVANILGEIGLQVETDRAM